VFLNLFKTLIIKKFGDTLKLDQNYKNRTVLAFFFAWYFKIRLHTCAEHWLRNTELDHLTCNNNDYFLLNGLAFKNVGRTEKTNRLFAIDTLGDISARTATLKSYCVIAMDVLSSTNNELFVATSRGSQKVSGG